MREAAKALMRALAWLVVTPSVLSWQLRALRWGRSRRLKPRRRRGRWCLACRDSTLRRAFLSRTLRACAPTATIEFGTLFSSAKASIGDRAYVGPRCHLGWAIIEADVLLAAGVHVPSGARTHGMDDPACPFATNPR